MREISSCAVTEPRIGIAHRFNTSMVVSPGARHAQCEDSISENAGPTPPSPLTTSTVTTSRPRASTMPWSKSVQASASSPPKMVYTSTVTVATAMPTLADMPSEADASTWPKARICAPAHRMEVGIISTTATCSTRGEYRRRNRSPSVVICARHSGPANTAARMTMTSA